MNKQVILIRTSGGYLTVESYNSIADALESMIGLRSDDLLDYKIVGADSKGNAIILREMKR